MNFSNKLLLPTFINPNKPKAVLTVANGDDIYGYIVNGEKVAEAESIDFHKTVPVYYGGPVKKVDSHGLGLLHKFPDVEPELSPKFDGIHAFAICKNIYFGTPIGLMNIYRYKRSKKLKDFMLLSGNLKWTQSTLDKEIEYGFWEIEEVNKHNIFDRKAIDDLAIDACRQKIHMLKPSLN
jgi:putative AlgH/UPF0301 family transcriptional regulator